MKLTLTHPLRDACLRLKMLCPAPPRQAVRQPVPPPRPRRRTIAFLDLP